MVRLLRKFIEATSCKFVVIDDSPEKLFKMLNGGMLDILLMPLEYMGDYPFSEPLWKEDVHLALSSVHALAEEAAVDVRRLNGESLLLGSHDHEGGTASSLINACQAAGVKAINHSVLLHWGVRLALVAAGIGIAVQPASRRCLLDTIGVVTRPLVSPLAMTIAAAWPEGGLTPFAFRFLELARTMNLVSK